MRITPLALFPALLLIPACPCCVDHGELRHVEGELPLAAGQAASFEFWWRDELYSGPGRCGMFWSVGDGDDGSAPVVGGDESLGLVDDCGRFAAPAVAPARGAVWLYAEEFEPGTCADCCPSAWRRIEIVD